MTIYWNKTKITVVLENVTPTEFREAIRQLSTISDRYFSSEANQSLSSISWDIRAWGDKLGHIRFDYDEEV